MTTSDDQEKFTIEEHPEDEAKREGWEDVEMKDGTETESHHGVEVDEEGKVTADHSEGSEMAVMGNKPESFKMTVAGRDMEVDTRMVPLIGQFLSAMVVLISITVPDLKLANHAYGISMAVISMAFNLLGMFFLYTKTDEPLGTVPFLGVITCTKANSLFLWLWWMVGVGVLTFNGPFVITSNGYFGSWAGFCCATSGITDIDSIKKQAKGFEGYKNLLLVASVVLLCALPKYIGDNTTNPYVTAIEFDDVFSGLVADIDPLFEGEAIYALIVVVLTIILLLAIKLSSDVATAIRSAPVWEFFSVLWLILACLVTFRGPFLNTGNGYFASWAGLMFCVMIAVKGRSPVSQTESEGSAVAGKEETMKQEQAPGEEEVEEVEVDDSGLPEV